MLTRPARGEAKYARQAEGRGHYAHVKIHIHPGEPASGFVFENRVVGEAIPDRFISAVEQGLRQAAADGVPAGCSVVDVRVELEDGSYHDVDSTAAAFELAAVMAFQDAVRNAGPLADDGMSSVTEPRRPVTSPPDAAVALPEPDDPIEDD